MVSREHEGERETFNEDGEITEKHADNKISLILCTLTGGIMKPETAIRQGKNTGHN